MMRAIFYSTGSSSQPHGWPGAAGPGQAVGPLIAEQWAGVRPPASGRILKSRTPAAGQLFHADVR